MYERSVVYINKHATTATSMALQVCGQCTATERVVCGHTMLIQAQVAAGQGIPGVEFAAFD